MPSTSIFIEDYDLRIAVSTLLIDENSETKPDITIGGFLTLLKSFNDMVLDARHELALKELPKVSDTPDVQEIASLYTDLSEEHKAVLRQNSRHICERYKLSSAWRMPVQIAILTHCLFVPPDPSIRLRLPQDSALANIINDLGGKGYIPSQYPVIYPVYQVSMHELDTFIEQNTRAIRRAVRNLPPRPTTRTERQTNLWGRMAWLMRAETPRPTWAKVAEKINELTDGLRGELSATLTEVEVQDVYRRFAATVQRLDQRSS